MTTAYGDVAYGTGLRVRPVRLGGYGTLPYGTGEGVASGTETPIPQEPTELVIFLTPLVQDEPPFLWDSSPMQFGLFRHYANRYRGVNVWERSDGTFVQDTPTPFEAAQTSPAPYIQQMPIGPDLTANFQTDSNVNYPWNPFPGSGPESPDNPGQYATVTNWDQTVQDFALDPYMVTWFEPGAEVVVTQAEALILTAAGYGDCLSADTEGTAPSFGPGGNEFLLDIGVTL